MKKNCTVLLIAVLALSTLLVACNISGATLTAVVDTFDFDKSNDVVYEVTFDDNEQFLFLEGHNIADGDYVFSNGVLTVKRDFLTTLDDGEYTLDMVTTKGRKKFDFKVVAPNKQYKVVNGSFETGDLFGWNVQTTFKGENAIQSFVNDGVKENTTFFTFDAPYNGVGKYVYGFDDRDGENKDKWNERMGVMRSSAFTLGGSGYISFMLGGGKNTELCYMSVRDAETDYELARYGNTMFNSCSYELDPSQYFEANLVKYKADLTQYLGRKLYVEFVDVGGRDWDLLTIDNVITYNEQQPASAVLAQDLKPSYTTGYVTNQLPNGDFSRGLADWTVSSASGFDSGVPAFVVDNGVLKSNGGGDASRGLIRSSLFRVDGSGIISMRLGAACGARFDKDTYVSVKERNTNREIFRFANRNSNGNEMMLYYVDLSNYIGAECYIEIVDNAVNSWDVIFVSEIVTYYAVTPEYDFSSSAVNLIK